MIRSRVVLDTNVLIQAMMGTKDAFSLIRAAADGRLSLVYSAKLAYELEEVTERPSVSGRLSLLHAQLVWNTLATDGRMVPDRALINTEPLVSDRDDDFVIQLTRQAEAILISGDKALLATAPPGLAVLHVDDAARGIAQGGSLQLALADRRGEPALLL